MRSFFLVLALIATPWASLAAADPPSLESSARIEWIDYTTRETKTVFCVEPIDPYQPWGFAVLEYDVVASESGLELVPHHQFAALYAGDVDRWTEIGLDGEVAGIEVDHEVVFGPGSIVVGSCLHSLAWTDEVSARSEVVVYAAFNAIETRFERTLTPTSRIDTKWSINTSKVHALSVHDFEEAPTWMHFKNEAVDWVGTEVVVGGRQEIEVSEGFYGRFSHSDPEGGGVYGVTRPDGGKGTPCPVRVPLCDVGGLYVNPNLLAGGPGRYAFWNEVTKSGHLMYNFHAFWVDAPFPPGVTVPS